HSNNNRTFSSFITKLLSINFQFSILHFQFSSRVHIIMNQQLLKRYISLHLSMNTLQYLTKRSDPGGYLDLQDDLLDMKRLYPSDRRRNRPQHPLTQTSTKFLG